MKRSLLAILLMTTAVHADPLEFRVKPGGAALMEQGVVSRSSPGRVGVFRLDPSGVHHYRIERPPFDSLDISVAPGWSYTVGGVAAALKPTTLIRLSRTVHLNVTPPATAYIDSDNSYAASDSIHTLNVAGVPHNVTPLEAVGDRVRIVSGWSPPVMYLSRPMFQTRILQIPDGALDTPADVYPPASIVLEPRYGPFSYAGFDIVLGVLGFMATGWWLGRVRPRRQAERQQRDQERALLRTVLTVHEPAEDRSGPLTSRTIQTETGVRYVLLNLLGRGGMGAVYEATAVDDAAETEVAIKVLANAARDDERFRREIRVCQSLSHPAIVKVLDWGICAVECGQAAPFMVMERVHGRTLRHDGAPVSADQVRDWLRQTLQGLRAAHRAGVVHRDIKPDNLMVTATNHIKILDFGVAQVLALPPITQTGAAVGTPLYMAPEQVEPGPVPPSADIYALGMVAYELLAGRHPDEGETNVWALLARRTIHDPPSLGPHVPADLAAVVMRMLTCDAAMRYRDADSVLNAL